MKLTAALKSYAVVKSWLSADADDAAFNAKIAEKLIAGEIDAAKIAELTADAGGSAGVKSMIVSTVNEAMAPVLAQLAKMAGGNNPDPAAKAAEDAKNAETKKLADERAAFEERVQKSVTALLEKQGISPNSGGGPTRLFAGAARLAAKDVGTTKALDRFDRTKSGMFHDSRSKHKSLAGQRVCAPSEGGPGTGRPLDNPSHADRAVCGAYFKWALSANNRPGEYPAGLKMTDLDYQIIQEALHEQAWCGTAGKQSGGLDNESGGIGVDNALLSETSRKALLDDSTSGGITMVPQVFDDAVIQYPLLYGELFPYVAVENLAMGRRIEAPTMARVTLTSGTAEGTAIPLFDTTAFIGALDTTIQNVVGAIELGNDFQEDTPVANLGQRVIQNYGEALQQWLDLVIALGDGTTQPLGIFNTSGLTAVSSANQAQGPVAVGDLEGLMFGVVKEFRTSRGGNSNVYIGNEVSYRRVRGIPIGTAYNGRVFGENYGDYMALGFPYKIAPTVTNSQLAFVNMAWYKMYRRLGGQIKVETGGKELTLRNVTLIAYRARYGGRMQAGGAASVISDLEA